MKKIISLILVAMLLLSTFQVSIFASTNPTISCSNVTANAGDTVSVDVNLTNNPGIVSMTLNVEFDSSALTLVSVTDKGVLGTQAHKPEKSSPYTLAWANDTATTNYTVNGTIATLTFKVNDVAVAGKAYPISVSYDRDNYHIYDKDLNLVDFDISNGSISLEQPKTLSSISVHTEPTKVIYNVGESLDTTGLQLKLTYSDNSTEYVSTGFTTSGFDSTTAGTKTVTVTYNGKTATFDVTVNEVVNLGDANGDGNVDATDATFILQHYANIATIQSNFTANADVNNNGNIDATDATLVLQYYANIISSFT